MIEGVLHVVDHYLDLGAKDMIDAVVTLGGIVIPPVFDFLRKKFIRADKDTPEATLSTLATTKPELMPEYMESVSTFMKAKKEWFNRDIIGVPSQWIIDLRASIRPICVVVGVFAFIFSDFMSHEMQKGVTVFFEGVISSWFGSRLCK